MRTLQDNRHKAEIQAAIWLLPVLFLIDDVLGFNGYQFTIFGKSIRVVLFCASVAVLCCYSVYIIWEEHISLIPKGKREKSLWHMLKPLDYFVAFFILGNFLWATVVPFAVRGEMNLSLKDYSTILVLVLYFPLAFLIRTGRLNLRAFEKLLYSLILVLATWHCVMYIGDTLKPGFYASYYDFIDMISFGTAVRSNVIYGFGIVRVIQVTSLFLLPGIFLAVRYILAGKYVHFLPLILLTFAICVTYTKSIWFGYILGLFFYLVLSAVLSKDKRVRIRSVLTFLIVVLVIFVLNYMVFQNMIFARAFNTTRSNESITELQTQLEALQQEDQTIDNGQQQIDDNQNEWEINNKLNELKDAQGTQEANYLRSEQINALLSKWKENKLFGYGYGSYAEDCIRSKTYPFMYETTLPALIMKLGIVGCLIWVALIVAATVSAGKAFWKEKRTDVFWWLGMALSYALAVQTNPFLFTFTGFSILLYLLVSMQKKADWEF